MAKKKPQKRNVKRPNKNGMPSDPRAAALGKAMIEGNFKLQTPELSPEAVEAINNAGKKFGDAAAKLFGNIARNGIQIGGRQHGKATRMYRNGIDGAPQTAIEVGAPVIDGSLLPPSDYEDRDLGHHWRWEVVEDEITITAFLPKCGDTKGQLRIAIHRLPEPAEMSVEYAEKIAQGLLSACVLQTTVEYRNALHNILNGRKEESPEPESEHYPPVVDDGQPMAPAEIEHLEYVTSNNKKETSYAPTQTPSWYLPDGPVGGVTDDDDWDVGSVQG